MPLTSRPEIIFYFDSPFFSGAEMQAVRNAQRIAKDGLTLGVYFRPSGDLGAKLREKIEGEKVFFHEMPSRTNMPTGQVLLRPNRFKFLRVFIWARKMLRLVEPKTIHVNNGGYPGATGSRAFALASLIYCPNSRIVFSVNNLAVSMKDPRRWLQAPIDFLLSRSRIFWVTASITAANRLSRVLSLKKTQVTAIPNGMDTPKCTCSQVGSPKQYKPANAKLAITQIGHLEPRKGQRVLIEAARILRDVGALPENVVFLIEGDGPMEGKLIALRDKYRLQRQIHFLGRISCVYHLLIETEILAHPSVAYEDLPNVISEAMSLGIPVVGSDVGGIAEQISNLQTGFIVKPGNTRELAERILELLGSEGLRSRMGIAAKKKYSTHFTANRASDAYRRVYFE